MMRAGLLCVVALLAGCLTSVVVTAKNPVEQENGEVPTVSASRRQVRDPACAGAPNSRLYITGTTPSVRMVPTAAPKEMTIAML